MNNFIKLLKTFDNIIAEYKALLSESIISPSLKQRIFKLTFVSHIKNITEYYYENKISIDQSADGYFVWSVVSFLEDNTIEQLQKIIETTNFKFEASSEPNVAPYIIPCKSDCMTSI